MENALITIQEKDGSQWVDARELWEKLESQRQFGNWVKVRIRGLTEGSDYKKYKTIKRQIEGKRIIGRPLIQYLIKKTIAEQIEASHYFTITRKEKEYNFKEMLEKIVGVPFEYQYRCCDGKYAIDFYYESKLIVEYDEKHHKNQTEKDEIRMNEIREWLSQDDPSDWKCPVIRVKEGEEYQGLNRIIRHLVGFEAFEEMINYNLEPCDIGNR
jgi:very-short-patch-repair endonuclease